MFPALLYFPQLLVDTDCMRSLNPSWIIALNSLYVANFIYKIKNVGEMIMIMKVTAFWHDVYTS